MEKEILGRIYSDTWKRWYRAPQDGTTGKEEEAYLYTEKKAKELLETYPPARSSKYRFVPLETPVAQDKSALVKLYSFRGQPDVGKLLHENPKAEHLLLEINDPGKNLYWAIISRKFASQRILDNKEQALRTFEMLTEPEPPKEERWVVTWDGKRSLSSSAVPSILATKPGDPFAVVRTRGDKAWYHFKGNAVAENDKEVGVEEAFRLVEKARLAARGPHVKVFGVKRP